MIMHATFNAVIILIIGVLLIVFSEIFGRRINNLQQAFVARETDAIRTRILCILLGTICVVSAALKIFG
jgi:hypothetical protein